MRETILGVIFAIGLAIAITGMQFRPQPQRYTFSYPNYVPKLNEPGTNLTTVEGVALGKKLFNDKVLSVDGKVSCASCHYADHAFADRARFSYGIDQKPTPRNAMPLFNLGWYPFYFWDGRATTLEEAVLMPIRHADEMGKDMNLIIGELAADTAYLRLFTEAFGTSKVSEQRIARALAQYLRTLVSYGTSFDKAYPKLTSRVGFDLLNYWENNEDSAFNYKGRVPQLIYLCEKCHRSAPSYGGVFRAHNGIELPPTAGVEIGDGLIKAPTLRNLLFTAPYMHDGRFQTLEEVLDYYSEGIIDHPLLDPALRDSTGQPLRLHLTQFEKAEFISFLSTLSDTSFIEHQHTASQ